MYVGSYELWEAVWSGDLAEVQRILKHNPNITVDALNYDGRTPLLEAIMYSHKPIIVRGNKKRGVLLLLSLAWTALESWFHPVIEKDYKSIVEFLLDHGAAVNGLVDAYRTPLQQTCDSYRARSDIVSLLLEHGADVEATTARERRTSLTLACRKKEFGNSNLGIAQLLINAGADVNGVGGGGIAPLHAASRSGNTEAVELLIQSGADLNILSNEGYLGVPAGSTPFVLLPTLASWTASVSYLQLVQIPILSIQQRNCTSHGSLVVIC